MNGFTPIRAITQAPLVDPKTGKITREGYYFLLGLFNIAGGDTSNTTIPDVEVLIATDTPVTVENVNTTTSIKAVTELIASQVEFNPGPINHRVDDLAVLEAFA